MAGFMQLDRKLFAGHRQTLSSRCVIPSGTYLCAPCISRYSHVSKPQSRCDFRALKRREDRLEASRLARFAKLRNDFFSLADSPRLPFAIAKSARDARVHYVGQFFFRPFARRSPRAALQTLEPEL